MKTLSMDSVMMRGAVAALLAAGGAGTTRAQVVSAGPERQIAKDSAVVRIKAMPIMRDSLRELMRAFDAAPLLTKQSERTLQELEQKIIAFNMAFGGQGIFVGAPAATLQFRVLPPKGWIGITTAGVHNDWASDGHLVQYLDYPPIVSVERRSPAQVAGIMPGDTLVAYDGVDVVAHPVNVSRLFIPEKRIAVTVRRDGENKAFTLIVGRAPTAFKHVMLDSEPDSPFARFFTPDGQTGRVGNIAFGRGRGPATAQVFVFTSGVFGASLSSVSQDLAKKFNIDPGVYVNEVPDETPASRAGLKIGDLIVSVAGTAVTSVDEVRKLAALQGENRGVTLQVIRDKKTRSITVK